MGKFNRSNRRSRSDKQEMYTAVCDECGKNCEVPFKPTGSKPVFCSECFEKKGGSDDRRSSRRGRSRGGRSDRREMYSAKCDECGNRCELPFRPSSNKPVYCSECFEDKGEGRGSRNSMDEKNLEQLEERLEDLEEKIDKILYILDPPVRVKLPDGTESTVKIRKNKKKD